MSSNNSSQSNNNNKDDLTTDNNDDIPPTMKAAIINKMMKDDVPLSEAIWVQPNVPVPKPGPGELLVKVSAVSVNPIDWKLLQGKFPGKNVGSGFGFDVSGTVVKIGPSLDGDTEHEALTTTTTSQPPLKVGDRIYADSAQTMKTSGSYAEYCLVQTAAAHRIPNGLNMVQAAALPLAGLTAWQGLVTHGRLEKGQKVLIVGGAGGVGSLAVQMAKALGGAEVWSTGSSVDRIRALGADRVVNYRTENLMETLQGQDFDLVFDTIGGHWEVAQASLRASGGRYVTIEGDHHDDSLGWTVAKTLWRTCMGYLGWGPRYTLFLTNTKAPSVQDDMKQLTLLVETGRIQPVLHHEKAAFDELTTSTLHQLIELSMAGRAKGKLVLKVTSE